LSANNVFSEGRAFLRWSQVSGQALIDLLNHAKENGALAAVKKCLEIFFGTHNTIWGVSLNGGNPKTPQNDHF